eukprot:CAMPEP_0116904306 /NCGR_PEP_ID=MMETSP0467-20121206/11333_1 /TAXON_ID=283647 /ORGANISM="Mesodinium pulex, Strain SPMC105" /LENGTH=85 /DNA_ID=CAMNT_0004578911 /DNA_START=333 /DNA_END=590 /DNA_ORIENTATION=+
MNKDHTIQELCFELDETKWKAQRCEQMEQLYNDVSIERDKLEIKLDKSNQLVSILNRQVDKFKQFNMEHSTITSESLNFSCDESD